MSLPLFSRGEVVLLKFPFTDLTGSSLRPALVVSDKQIGLDIVLIGISSVIRGAVVSPTDYVLDATHPEFGLTGLRVSSVLRMHKLVTVESSVIVRRLGHIGSQTQSEVDKLLRIVLKL